MLFTNTSLEGCFTMESRIHKVITEGGVCNTSKRQLTLKGFFFFDRSRLLDFHAWSSHSVGLAHICLVIDIMQLSCNLFALASVKLVIHPSTKMQTVSFLMQWKQKNQKSSPKHKDFRAVVGNGFLAELVTRLRITDLPVCGSFVFKLERHVEQRC